MAASAARIAEVLAGLRASSARLRSAADLARCHLPTGMAAIDAALGGGLLRGKLTELAGARGSGRLSVTLAAAQAAQARGELVALVDAADALDPRSAHASGVALERLLWVRPRSLDEALKAADRVLDAGGFGLVVLYLCGVGGRVRGETAWARLQRRAEAARSAVLVVGDRPVATAFAAAGLEIVRGRARFVGQDAGKLYVGRSAEVRVVRSKLGPPGEPQVIELRVEDA